MGSVVDRDVPVGILPVMLTQNASRAALQEMQRKTSGQSTRHGSEKAVELDLNCSQIQKSGEPVDNL